MMERKIVSLIKQPLNLTKLNVEANVSLPLQK
jgi:hypothetical protein